MDPELTREWFSIRKDVAEGLRHASYVGAFGLPVCQVLTLPSFDNPVGWDVRKSPARRKEAETRLYRSCWRMDLDLDAFRSPLERLRHSRSFRPTVEVGWTPIDPGSLDGPLGKLRENPIPLAVAGTRIGLDGTRHELAVEGPMLNARINWWERMPEAWRPLEPIVKEMLDLFETTWNDGPCHSIDQKAIS